MKRFLTTAAAVLLAGTLFVGFAQRGPVPDRLILGMVPSREADVIVDSLGPIAEMLSERLLIPVDTFVATDFVGLVEASAPAASTSACSGRRAGAGDGRLRRRGPVLASVRQGSTTYRSQFNVRCDSGITEFEQLRGKHDRVRRAPAPRRATSSPSSR
jgi:phosphonate transport system substrate-binding protein